MRAIVTGAGWAGVTSAASAVPADGSADAVLAAERWDRRASRHCSSGPQNRSAAAIALMNWGSTEGSAADSNSRRRRNSARRLLRRSRKVSPSSSPARPVAGVGVLAGATVFAWTATAHLADRHQSKTPEASPIKSNRVIPVIRNSSLTAGQNSAARYGRPMDRVVTVHRIMGGVPCVRGTWIPVATILGLLGEGLTPADVLTDRPSPSRPRGRPRLPAIRCRRSQRTDPAAAAALIRRLSVRVLPELPVRPRDTQHLRCATLSPQARRHLEHMTAPLTPIGAVPCVPRGAKTRLPTNFHKTAGAVDIDVATRATLRPLLGHRLIARHD